MLDKSKFMKLKPIKEFILLPEGANIEDGVAFHTGDYVYTPPALDKGRSKRRVEQISPDEYWLAEIMDIRIKNNEVFVLLHWFLQAEDISDVVGYEEADIHVGAIGGVERVKSNWEGVESCQLIEDHASVHYFDDRALSPDPAIGKKDFFYRWTLDVSLPVTISGVHSTCSSKCTKDNIYYMGLNTQRYCPNCLKWFHVTCLKASDGKCKGLTNNLDESILIKAPMDLAMICSMPIERSATCQLGNGGLLNKALDLLKNGHDDWRSILGEGVVQKMLQDQEYTVFQCAECDILV